ncbi:hypothetical protein TVAG_222330 [Trichomonas vaginalis G3]|uniref:Uncharacterized protein n=1 Tax=Trichomonas vaginalis (strain ATCC PRA-98 / G3) TaxID=412133 RepID=A2G0N9_TRIV3|nr:hypothetical protein TVAGG3_0891970 [Trichomonas vaginalis G3]EAX89279.1 hypothetical protein TVAG_222330 [Trichomonas vaginalis G3]KAI5502786.1 hypothetical protein TVAGG3_0891970 [Trichomonas vaginalis G3]|eukprot:XP_001302209.1 hypothetical protein [Trichomonas vaginalis G3]
MSVQLLENILEEAKKPSGTWSYEFITETHRSIKRLRDREFSTIVIGLSDFFEKSEDNVLTKFKIAQLLSSIKIQNPSRCEEVYQMVKESLLKASSELPETQLSIPCRKLIETLYDQRETPIRQHHIRAMSKEPTCVVTRSTNPAPKATTPDSAML